jgi:DNA repair protein RecO (recombination protein O)
MHWNDSAILLSARKHGETSAVVRVLARGHGVYAGIVKGASSKANRGIVQPGNLVGAHWNARLSEHLGMFRLELAQAHAAHLMHDAARLAALSSCCALMETALPERHPYPALYAALEKLLSQLQTSDDWPLEYIRLELAILAETGFGLDLSKCAATGAVEDLLYVSPKSGRAVSRQAGEPYQDKLLKLPAFLLPLSRGAGEGQGGGDLIPRARELRKGQSDAEQKLWYYLRAHRFQHYGFRRQKPIGSYIIDFVCMEKKLVIELDGGQHTEQQAYDRKRTKFLESQGYRVLRFWNDEMIKNEEAALQIILSALEEQNTPSLTLPPSGRGDIIHGLALTGYFLEHWLLTPHNRKLPSARGRLLQTLYKPAETL